MPRESRVVYDGPSVALTPALLRELYGAEADDILSLGDHISSLQDVKSVGPHLVWPTPVRVAQPVFDFASAELAALLEDLRDTMAHLDGAGLAAPQIGVDLRVVIFGSDEVNPRYPDASPLPGTVLINPVLEPLSNELEEGWEGCLSVPGLRGVVPRWRNLRYSGFDEHGRHFERVVEGFHARVVQHECDHLDGVLYPMRMRDFSRFGFNDELDTTAALLPIAEEQQ